MDAVFLFPPDATSKSREIMEDDLVSRQGLTTRDGRSLADRDGTLVFVQGDADAIRRFEELAKGVATKLGPEETEQLVELLRKEEEDAAEGVGLLFGGN